MKNFIGKIFNILKKSKKKGPEFIDCENFHPAYVISQLMENNVIIDDDNFFEKLPFWEEKQKELLEELDYSFMDTKEENRKKALQILPMIGKKSEMAIEMMLKTFLKIEAPQIFIDKKIYPDFVKSLSSSYNMTQVESSIEIRKLFLQTLYFLNKDHRSFFVVFYFLQNDKSPQVRKVALDLLLKEDLWENYYIPCVQKDIFEEFCTQLISFIDKETNNSVLVHITDLLDKNKYFKIFRYKKNMIQLKEQLKQNDRSSFCEYFTEKILMIIELIADQVNKNHVTFEFSKKCMQFIGHSAPINNETIMLKLAEGLDDYMKEDKDLVISGVSRLIPYGIELVFSARQQVKFLKIKIKNTATQRITRNRNMLHSELWCKFAPSLQPNEYIEIPQRIRYNDQDVLFLEGSLYSNEHEWIGERAITHKETIRKLYKEVKVLRISIIKALAKIAIQDVRVEKKLYDYLGANQHSGFWDSDTRLAIINCLSEIARKEFIKGTLTIADLLRNRIGIDPVTSKPVDTNEIIEATRLAVVKIRERSKFSGKEMMLIEK